MKSALKPALEDLDDALQRLEEAVDTRLQAAKKSVRKEQEAPQLDLSVRNERDVSRKIAAKLDQTINRLEMLLAED